MRARILGVVAVAMIVTSCAAPHRRTGVNIEQRPTPAQPDSTPAAHPTSDATPSNKTVQQAIGEVVRDTSAARIALDKCAGRKLLPEQESVVDGTEALLVQVRQALSAQDFPSARRLAREARSLASSAGCR
jgi:hypothetical protein